VVGVASSGVARPEIWGGAKMFDFRQITLFSLEKRLSKHKMTAVSKNFWGAWPLSPPLATPTVARVLIITIRVASSSKLSIGQF